MYESETYEKVRDRMLAAMPNDIDKREGSLAFDATAPAAIEIMYLYMALDMFLQNTFGDTATRPYLIERAKERGLTPLAATPSVVRIVPTPKDIEIPTGSRFSCADVNFKVTSVAEDKNGYLATCETAGTVGNKPNGSIIPIDYIPNLSKIEITEVVTAGEDEEETEVFRQRYLKSFNSVAYGGNIQDYKEKVGAIAGVGGVKVYPVWNGGGTVKVVFSTSDNKPPATGKVQEVQTLIDPVTNSGDGLGIAPIGHRVTVLGTKSKAINITFKPTFKSGTLASHLEQIEAVVKTYFEELNAGWEATQTATVKIFSDMGLIIRLSQIESRIMGGVGDIIDIEETALNGEAKNLMLQPDELAELGTISEVSQS